MKFKNKQVLALILSSLFFLSGTTSAIDLFKEDKSDVIWEAGKNAYVIYAKQDSSKTGKNDHPVELNELHVRKALQSLVIEGSQYSEEQVGSEMLFSQGQVNVLAKQLIKGLVRAKPTQDIVFALKRAKGRLFGLKQTQEFVAGRVFFQDGKLNLIIGDYNLQRQEGFEAVYDPTNVGITKYRFFQGSRSKNSKKFKIIIAQAKGIKQKSKDRNDWFVIDTKLAAAAFDVAERTREKGALAAKRQEIREAFGDEFGGASSKERAQMNRERREMRAEMARMRKEMGQMNTNGGGSVEKRMASLKSLKEKGLISEKEYQAKRQEILKDL